MKPLTFFGAFLIFLGMMSPNCQCALFSRSLIDAEKQGLEWEWEISEIAPFNEAIVSWNGIRPNMGKWTIFVSLHQNSWSPWLKYAEWSPEEQKTFKSSPEDSFAETYQDGVNPKSGFCDGIRIKVAAEEGASLTLLDSLFICLSDLSQPLKSEPLPLIPVLLPNVPGQSQMVLDHPRGKDMCSPTSTSTAVNYLLGRRLIDPLQFASRSHDDGFDIYGNWILNTAEASHQLGGVYTVHVERLPQFSDLHRRLLQGLPVVVSVKGSLPGAPLPYKSGHLICVIGFDPAEGRVFCIDSAYPNNESTFVSYPIEDFLNAWNTRRRLAYIFSKK